MKLKRIGKQIITVRALVLFTFVLIVLLPLLNIIFTSLRTSESFVKQPLGFTEQTTFINYSLLFDKYRLHDYFGNSFVFTFGTVLLVIMLSSMITYACLRIGGWKGSAIFSVFILGMLIPAQVNIVPLYSVVTQIDKFAATIDWASGFRMKDTLYGLILIKASVLLSLSVFILSGFMKTIPRELFEAAAVDGSTEWWMYARVAIPLSLPAIATSSIFLSVIVWNDLLYPLLFTGEKARTLTMALLMFRGEYESNYPVLFSAVIIVSIPLVVTYLLFQRWFIAGITSGSIKG